MFNENSEEKERVNENGDVGKMSTEEECRGREAMTESETINTPIHLLKTKFILSFVRSLHFISHSIGSQVIENVCCILFIWQMH